ncbi:MAG: polymorphic outer membrane protein [Rhodoglobus sp.]|nr:polymorphic outer membrane protein [Rhodoglobus sp.]
MDALRPPRLRVALSALLAVGLAFAGVLAAPHAAAAAPPVFNGNDSGIGSLRFAIDNSLEGDIIVIPATVTSIALQSPLVLPHSLDIRGPGAGVLTISRNAASGNFHQVTILPVNADQDFTLSGMTFVGNAVQTGIAILASIGTFPARDLTLTGIVVTDQHNNYGPAVNTYQLQGDLLVDDSRFDDNGATGGVGGALSIDQSVGNVDIRDSSFSGNTATDEGGAVFIRHHGDPANVTVQTVAFDGNSSTALDAGGLYISGAPGVVISDATTFTGNKSEIDGGGAYFYAIGDLTVTETIFSDNTAADQGGGMFLVDVTGHVSVSSTSFLRNVSSADGGGIYAISVTTADITDSDFEQNQAGVRLPPVLIDGYGAGAYLGTVTGSVAVSGTRFVGNSAPEGSGGGLAVDTITGSGSVGIATSLFLDNDEFFGGGGLWVGTVDSGALPAISVDSSTFSGNISNKGGSAGSSILVEQVLAPVSIVNSTFDERADLAGNLGALAFAQLDAVAPADVLVEISSSTIAGPGALAVYNVTDGLVAVTNSVLESVAGQPAIVTSGVPNDTIAIDYSLLTSAETPAHNTGVGVVYSVPDMRLGPLAANGGPTPTRLPLVGSPVWDAGSPSAIGLPTDDQRGVGFPRVLGGRADVGAVESPRLLPATGQSVNLWVPIGGGILLLLGAGAVFFARFRGRGAHRSASRTGSVPESD